MVKCQYKNNYPCLLKKHSSTAKYKTLRLKFGDVPFGEFRIWIERYISEFRKLQLKLFFSLHHIF